MSIPLAYNQLGFRPQSANPVSLSPAEKVATKLPDTIPAFLHRALEKLPRTQNNAPDVWTGKLFNWPFDLESGELDMARVDPIARIDLKRSESNWGPVWQGHFEGCDPNHENSPLQVTTPVGSSFPFWFSSTLYDRLSYAYLNYLLHQRSGYELPGFRAAGHLDDAVLDSDGSPVHAVGGWYDAGDLRKWMFLTLPNLQSLATLAERGPSGLRERAIDEIRWGNRFFHSMISPEGQVWEDIGGGRIKPGIRIPEDWWFENHPGCNCDGSECRWTDNVSGSGDERFIRTTQNPAIQSMFVRLQARIAPLLSKQECEAALILAERAWKWSRNHRENRRTLFVAEELHAAIELRQHRKDWVSTDEINELVTELLGRQQISDTGLSGSFMEAGHQDGFRSLSASASPAMALMRLIECRPEGCEEAVSKAEESIRSHIDGYLLADARTNLFGYPPYGLYVDPPSPDLQDFRDAGNGMGVRSFIHPINPQEIVHGCGGVALHHAALCARAGAHFNNTEWSAAAERIVHWTLGHNPQALCLHTGVGHRFPTPFSLFGHRIPDAVCVGHNGRPDDTPYVETSPLLEWCTQEIWDINHSHLIETVLHL